MEMRGEQVYLFAFLCRGKSNSSKCFLNVHMWVRGRERGLGDNDHDEPRVWPFLLGSHVQDLPLSQGAGNSNFPHSSISRGPQPY